MCVCVRPQLSPVCKVSRGGGGVCWISADTSCGHVQTRRAMHVWRVHSGRIELVVHRVSSGRGIAAIPELYCELRGSGYVALR